MLSSVLPIEFVFSFNHIMAILICVRAKPFIFFPLDDLLFVILDGYMRNINIFSFLKKCISAAKSLGFEKSPLAYLVLKSRKCLIPSAISRGVSYASAGAGILDSTVSSDQCSSTL
jgi:hypothetical protein